MGVPVRVHLTCILALALLSYIIGRGFVYSVEEGLSLPWAIVIGGVIAVMLYGCLLAHECGHVAVASRRGVKTSAIVLSALGGEAKLIRDTATWSDELGIALAGPAVSLTLAIVSAVPLLLFEQSAIITTVAFYLAFANGVLAVMNLLPGYPLDGGRAVRAVLWRAIGDRARAARIATGAGKAVGGLMAAYGALQLVGVDWNGVWFVGLGWYIADAAAREWERERVRTMLVHSQAVDVVTAPSGAAMYSQTVDAGENAWEVVERMGALNDDGAVAVADRDGVVGLIEKRELPGLLASRLRTAH